MLHRAGRLDEAEPLYRATLTAAPEHADTLHFLGVLEGQRGRHDAALALIDRAIALKPGIAAVHYNRANLLRQAGRLDAALADYDRVLQLDPRHGGAWINRGGALQALERYTDAVASYDRALALGPAQAGLHASRASALAETGRLDEALASADAALALDPNHAGAHYTRGNVLIRLARAEEALASFARGLAAAPDDPNMHNNHGAALHRLGRLEEAAASYSRALALAPHQARNHVNRANVLMELHRADDALRDYDSALALEPDSGEALYGRASALLERKRHDEAIAAFEALLARYPDYPYAAGLLVFTRRTACDWSAHPQDIAALVRDVRAAKRVVTPLAFLAVSESAADNRIAATVLSEDKFPAARQPLWTGERYSHARIRVAYLSADFRDHAVAQLTAGLFERNDRARFDTIAISLGSDDGSAMRRRLEAAFGQFLDLRGRSDRAAAEHLRAMEVDIAIDLNGYTGSSRPGILALRPAPVQVNYLGFAGTMGAPYFDYILADRTVIPESDRRHYSEKVVYLPDSYLPADARRAISANRPTRSEAGLPETGFVFCSFNNSYKFSPETFDIWMRLLDQAPGSVLWLPRSNAAAMRNLIREAALRGIAENRLVFAPFVADSADHLARLALADLFLDTLPFNAHSTACDALWAGLPLLTCIGSVFAGRVAASALYAVGLPELVAESREAYEAKALDLARDPAALKPIREKLARNRETAPLFDTERFTRHFEAALTAMRQRSEQGLAPEAFAVGA